MLLSECTMGPPDHAAPRHLQHPLSRFYWAAPAIIFGLYFYLHLYLQMLWEGLSGLPARFPDGKRLDERACPWLLTCLVRRHFTRLREARPWGREVVSIFLAWWIVPLTLLWFWLRYLPRHKWGGTWLHIGLITACGAAGVLSYGNAARTLRGDRG